MTMTDPTLEPEAPNGPDDGPAEPCHLVWRSDERVLTGAAAGLAEGWGVDPAWVRLALTVLALHSGLGGFLYIAAWVLLPASSTAPPASTARRALGVAAGVGALLALGGEWIGSPWSVIVILAGTAAALWRRPSSRVGAPRPGTWAPPSPPSPVHADASARTPRPRRPREPRPPSVVGRLSLALALAVVAVVALASDGRPGPLAVAFGAAAAICGAGLAVAGFGRRARYLVVPAVLALGGSTVAASINGLGVRVGLSGDSRSYGASGLPPGIDQRAGDVQLDLTGATANASTVVRVGVGTVSILLDPDRPVRLDLRARVGLGSIDAIGQRRSTGYRPSVFSSIGPGDGTPVVTVDAAVGVGSIDVHYIHRPPTPAELTGVPRLPRVPALPGDALTVEPDGTEVFEGGARRLRDGRILLPDGTEVGPDGARRYGPGAVVRPGGTAELPDGTVIQATGTVVLPGGLVISPLPAEQRG
jgi:phage shock protein PspC (stress-responsive transcriptional regulator)